MVSAGDLRGWWLLLASTCLQKVDLLIVTCDDDDDDGEGEGQTRGRQRHRRVSD